MVKTLSVLIFITISLASNAKFDYLAEYHYQNKSDSSFNCSLTILPKGMIKGMIIRDYSSLPDTSKASPYQWMELALEQNILILFTVSTNYFPELYYDDSGPAVLDELVYHAVVKYKVPAHNIFIGGISASGTRALRYSQYCNAGKSKHHIKISGVFAVDSPLDLERFYRSAHDHAHHFKAGMLEESIWMKKSFPEKMGGSPDDLPEKYQKFSVFSHRDSLGGNVSMLKSTAVLFIHEPDVDWWTNERGASYYDFNSYDIAAAYTTLKTLNHQDIEMVTTSGKGFKNGERNCHSWTIVDEDYLIKWISERIKS